MQAPEISTEPLFFNLVIPRISESIKNFKDQTFRKIVK